MFGERLKGLREEKGLRQEDIGTIVGVGKSTISQYESGKRQPDPLTLQKIADYFSVTLDYLFGRNDLRYTNKKFDILSAIEDNDLQLIAGDSPLTQDQRLGILRALDNPSGFKKTTIPILGQVPAGIPIMTMNDWDGELEIPSNIEADFALQVSGDSMIGSGIHEGDYAICRETHGANSGNIVVALEDVGPEYSRGTLKYYFQENGRDVLRAANPDYEDIPLDGRHRITGIMTGLLREGHTSFGYFKDYISIRDYHLQEWNDVIEEVAKYGMNAAEVRQILIPQLEYLRRMATGKKANRSS